MAAASEPIGVVVHEYECGLAMEMLKIADAKLWFVSGREYNRLSGVVKEETFSVHQILQNSTRGGHALLTKCMIENIEWPLTPDSPIFRVGEKSFAFSMPGILYGLQLPQNCPEELLGPLKELFLQFGCYQDLWKGQLGEFIFTFEYDPLFWIRTQWPINFLADPILKSGGAYWKKDDSHIYNMNERVLRIQHMSILVKLITKGLVHGKINPTDHVVTIVRPGPSTKDIDDSDEVLLAHPTILMFSNILEVMEEIGLLKNVQYHSVDSYEPQWPPVLACPRFWNVNKDGLFQILKTISKVGAEVNTEVTIKVLQGQSCDKFFVPKRIMLEENKGGDQELRNEISFPILDEAGNRKYAEKTVVEQLELAPPHSELKCVNCQKLNKMLQKLSELSV